MALHQALIIGIGRQRKGSAHTNGETAEPGAKYTCQQEQHPGGAQFAVRIQRLDKGQQDGHDSGHAHELGQDDGDHTQDQDEHDAFFALCFADELAHPADDAGLAQGTGNDHHGRNQDHSGVGEAGECAFGIQSACKGQDDHAGHTGDAVGDLVDHQRNGHKDHDRQCDDQFEA